MILRWVFRCLLGGFFVGGWGKGKGKAKWRGKALVLVLIRVLRQVG